jgi:hypothetical protein
VKWKTIYEQVGEIHRMVYSSNNEEEESDFSKNSNRAKIKGDVDYKMD